MKIEKNETAKTMKDKQSERMEKDAMNPLTLSSSILMEYSEGENGEWIAKKQLQESLLMDEKRLKELAMEKNEMELQEHLHQLIKQTQLCESLELEPVNVCARTIVDCESLPLLASRGIEEAAMEAGDCLDCGTKIHQVLRDGALVDNCFCANNRVSCVTEKELGSGEYMDGKCRVSSFERCENRRDSLCISRDSGVESAG